MAKTVEKGTTLFEDNNFEAAFVHWVFYIHSMSFQKASSFLKIIIYQEAGSFSSSKAYLSRPELAPENGPPTRKSLRQPVFQSLQFHNRNLEWYKIYAIGK